MSGAVDHPVFDQRSAGCITLCGARVCVPGGRTTMLNLHFEIATRTSARDDLYSIAWMNCRVPIAVEHDRRQVNNFARWPGGPGSRRRMPTLHGGKRRWKVTSYAASQTRMNSDRCIELRISFGDHGGCRTTRR